jgi:hypothetical protein
MIRPKLEHRMIQASKNRSQCSCTQFSLPGWATKVFIERMLYVLSQKTWLHIIDITESRFCQQNKRESCNVNSYEKAWEKPLKTDYHLKCLVFYTSLIKGVKIIILMLLRSSLEKKNTVYIIQKKRFRCSIATRISNNFGQWIIG